MESNTIVVLPVVRKKPWINTEKFDKNKLLGASTIVQPFYGEQGLQTGLEGNPELQKEFEQKLGLPEGTLTPNIQNNYWSEEMNIKLDDGPTTFYKSNPKDSLKILVLKNHPKVANSILEISPDTDFYILDEQQETERKVSITEKKEKAYAIYSAWTASEKRQFLKLYGKGGPDMSDVDVKATLGTYLEENVDDFLLKTEFSKETLTVRAFIFDLVAYGVLRIRGSHYMDADEDLGTLEALTAYFLAPDKANQYLNYKDRLENAKRSHQ